MLLPPYLTSCPTPADVDSLLKKSESQHESPEDGCPFGPLTQRLLQALVEVRVWSRCIDESCLTTLSNIFVCINIRGCALLSPSRRTLYPPWRILLYQTFRAKMPATALELHPGARGKRSGIGFVLGTQVIRREYLQHATFDQFLPHCADSSIPVRNVSA